MQKLPCLLLARRQHFVCHGDHRPRPPPSPPPPPPSMSSKASSIMEDEDEEADSSTGFCASSKAALCLICGEQDASAGPSLPGSVPSALGSLLDLSTSSTSPASLCLECRTLTKKYHQLRQQLRKVELQLKERRKKRPGVGVGRHPEVKAEDERSLFESKRTDFVNSGYCAFCARRHKSIDSIDNSYFGADDDDPGAGGDDDASCRLADPARPYSCPKCAGAFATFHARQRHFLTMHAESAPTHECRNCAKTFSVAAKLAQHQSVCVDGVRHQCDLCDKSFVSKRNLKDHVNVVHERNPDSKKHRCRFCDRAFYKRSNLTGHELTHTSERNYPCQVPGCEKVFKRASSLRAHADRTHEGSRPEYLCQTCGKSFSSVTGMRMHVAKNHSEGGEGDDATARPRKSHRCVHCPKSFGCAADLKIHSVVHTKKREFACDDCGAAFSQKATLKDHQNVHLKLFQCHLCKKSFARSRYLKSHLGVCQRPRATVGKQLQSHEVVKMVTSAPATNTQTTPSSSTGPGSVSVRILQQQQHDAVKREEDDDDAAALLSTAEVLSQMGTITLVRYPPNESSL